MVLGAIAARLVDLDGGVVSSLEALAGALLLGTELDRVGPGGLRPPGKEPLPRWKVCISSTPTRPSREIFTSTADSFESVKRIRVSWPTVVEVGPVTEIFGGSTW